MVPNYYVITEVNKDLDNSENTDNQSNNITEEENLDNAKKLQGAKFELTGKDYNTQKTLTTDLITKLKKHKQRPPANIRYVYAIPADTDYLPDYLYSLQIPMVSVEK